jgi:hypothetical protein
MNNDFGRSSIDTSEESLRLKSIWISITSPKVGDTVLTHQFNIGKGTVSCIMAIYLEKLFDS